jgi:predicted ATPase
MVKTGITVINGGFGTGKTSLVPVIAISMLMHTNQQETVEKEK